jgi:hypothetical protein
MYSQEQVASIHRESDGVLRDLRALSFRGMDAAQNQANPHARTYLTQGVGRRVQVLQHAMRDVFRLFPPEQTAPLTRENITAVQINLHAFVINLAGVFDNWAWAYLYRHNLLQQVGGSLNVGMFKRPTQEVLPAVLRDYLQRDIAQWQAEYVKTYIDGRKVGTSSLRFGTNRTESEALAQCSYMRQWRAETCGRSIFTRR